MKMSCQRPGKILLLILILLLAGHFTSCEPEDWITEVDCYDCFGYRPDSALIIVNASFNMENPAIPLTIYRGDVGSEIVREDTITPTNIDISLAVGSTYAIKAKYKSGSKTIEVFDSDEMTLKDYGESCGYPCFIIKGGIYQLELAE